MSKNLIRLPVIETIKNAWKKTYGVKLNFFFLTCWLVFIEQFVVMFFGLSLVFIGLGLGKFFYNDITQGLKFVLPFAFIIHLFIIFVISQVIVYVGIKGARNELVKEPTKQSLKNAGSFCFGATKEVLRWSVLVKVIGATLLLAIIILLPMAIFNYVIIFINENYGIRYNLLTYCSALFSLLCFIIWPIYFLIRLYLTTAFVVMQKVNPWLAINLSFKATKSNFWRLIGLLIINVAIMTISIIPLFVGVLWSIPYCAINFGEVYKSLVDSRRDLTVENSV